VISIEGYFNKDDSIQLTKHLVETVYLTKVIPGYIAGSINIIGQGTPEGTSVYCQGKTDTIEVSNYFRIDSLLAGPLNIFAYKFDYKTSHIDTLLANGDSLLLEIQLFPGSNEFFTDFEDQDPVFLGEGDWQFGSIESSSVQGFSGSYVWCTVLTGNYSEGAHLDFLETQIYSIQGLVVPSLEFYHWYDIEDNYDGGNLKVSTDEGITWQILRPSPDYPLQALPDEYGNPMAGQPAFSGSVNDWEQVTFSLSEFVNSPFLKFRFDFGTDEQKVSAGWYIDNFKIFDANATQISGNPIVSDVSELEVQIYPNPANPVTNISFRSSISQTIESAIYNINGQRINQIEINAQANQLYQWQWRGVNFQNLSVSSGIYFVTVKTRTQILKRKIVLIR